ncbi:hypothetical protein TGCAST_221455, partial [Toxoplasma gondii CAST]
MDFLTRLESLCRVRAAWKEMEPRRRERTAQGERRRRKEASNWHRAPGHPSAGHPSEPRACRERDRSEVSSAWRVDFSLFHCSFSSSAPALEVSLFSPSDIPKACEKSRAAFDLNNVSVETLVARENSLLTFGRDWRVQVKSTFRDAEGKAAPRVWKEAQTSLFRLERKRPSTLQRTGLERGEGGEGGQHRRDVSEPSTSSRTRERQLKNRGGRVKQPLWGCLAVRPAARNLGSKDDPLCHFGHLFSFFRCPEEASLVSPACLPFCRPPLSL